MSTLVPVPIVAKLKFEIYNKKYVSVGLDVSVNWKRNFNYCIIRIKQKCFNSGFNKLE
jgi:hypothetical protein